MRSNVDVELEHLLRAGRVDRGSVGERSTDDRADEPQRGVSRFGQRTALHRPESVYPGEVSGLRAEHPDVEGGRSPESGLRDYPGSGEVAKRTRPGSPVMAAVRWIAVIAAPGCKAKVNRT